MAAKYMPDAQHQLLQICVVDFQNVIGPRNASDAVRCKGPNR